MAVKKVATKSTQKKEVAKKEEIKEEVTIEEVIKEEEIKEEKSLEDIYFETVIKCDDSYVEALEKIKIEVKKIEDANKAVELARQNCYDINLVPCDYKEYKYKESLGKLNNLSVGKRKSFARHTKEFLTMIERDLS